MSQFNYCPLVWMCHHYSVNSKINRLHEICLRIIYSDRVSSFQDQLDKIDVSQYISKILRSLQ